MIARLWHGRTAAAHADAYLTFLHERAVPDYAGVEGCLGVYVLHRTEGDVAHFQTLTFWTDEAVVRAFAGDDVLRAKYYPEDDGFLLEQGPFVQHFEVLEGVALSQLVGGASDQAARAQGE
ncbi:MAG: antibiotic biosynthesis monooxygenase [Bacteroidota bacterium]